MYKVFKNIGEEDADVYEQTSMRENTYKKILNELLRINPGLEKEKIVFGDIGCGISKVPSLIPETWVYKGTSIRKQEINASQVIYYHNLATDATLIDEFDISVCVHTLPYISDQFGAMVNLMNMTKKNGYVAIVYHFKPEGTLDYSQYFYFLSHFGMTQIIKMCGGTIVLDEELPIDGHLLIIKKDKEFDERVKVALNAN